MKNIICILVFLLFSCKSSDKRDSKAINAIKTSLSSQLIEIEDIIESINHQQVNITSIRPYFSMILRLENMVLSHIDTSFAEASIDTSRLNNNIKELQKEYCLYIDSLKKQPDIQRRFEDEKINDSVKFELIYSSENSYDVNYFLTVQNILNQHKSFLKEIRRALSPSDCGFDTIDHIGYHINVYENTDICRVKFHFSFGRKSVWIPKEIIKIVSETNQVIKVNKTYIENDNLYIETDKLEKGNYSTEIKYELITDNGDKISNTFYLSFSIW